MINEYIDRILVHEADRSSGERLQKVEVYFNFIGKFDAPISVPEPTPEELAEAERLRQLRVKRKEYNRRYQKKKRLARQELALQSV